MATTIVAADTIPKGQTTIPYFDWSPFLGIPFWVFVGLFLLLILITVNLYWIFRLKRLASVKGYVTVMKKATQEDVMVWVLSTTRNLTIECLHKRDTILEFYNKLRISKWFHDNQISVVHLGGKGAMIVTENYYRTRDMVSEIALCFACEEFNRNQERYQREQPNVLIPLIKDYDDYVEFGRDELERRHPNGPKIPSFNIWDPQWFSKYFPKGLSSMFFGGIVVRLARKKKVTSKQQGLLEKYLGLGMFLTLSLIFVIAAWMVPL